MKPRRFWSLIAVGIAAIAVLTAASAGTRQGGALAPAQLNAQGSEDVQALHEKLRAFGAVGGQVGDIRNRGDLQRAIEVEAARLAEESQRRDGTVHLDDVQRLNAKLELFAALGGDPHSLEGVRSALRDAIEGELRQLRRREGDR